MDGVEAVTHDGEIISLGRQIMPWKHSPCWLELPESIPFDDWKQIGSFLKSVERGVMWWIGDWLRFGERHYGEMYKEAIAVTEYSYGTLAQAKYVASAYEFSSRLEDLSWAHHQEAAALPPDARAAVLTDASREVWTVRELRAEVTRRRIEAERGNYESGIADGCSLDDLVTLAESGKRFKVIYADPPWSFEVYSGKGKSRSADRHYNTMSLDDIKAMPVEKLADDDCALFLWAVMPDLPGAIDVIKAWGFTYKTVGFTWVKTTKSGGLHWGMGYWTRANPEVCLLATRGAPKRQASDVHQVIMSPVGEHSRKPEETSARIERLLPGPYLELFGRRPMRGWTVWGNQITRGLFHQDITEISL